MGELNTQAKAQSSLIDRARSARRQIYLANLGLRHRVEEEQKKQMDKWVAAGEKLRGDRAAGTAKPVLAVYGLADILKHEATRLFDDLVAAGEKRQSH